MNHAEPRPPRQDGTSSDDTEDVPTERHMRRPKTTTVLPVPGDRVGKWLAVDGWYGWTTVNSGQWIYFLMVSNYG